MQRRSAAGLSVNANYTLSRCRGLEMPPNAQSGIGFTNPADPDADRGHCDADRTHLANGTVGYLTPHVGSPVVGMLASNWRVSGIVSVRSGSWMDVLSGRDNAFNGQANQRVDQVSSDVYGAEDTGELSEPGGIRAAGQRRVRHLRAQQHPRTEFLEGRSRIVGLVPVARRTAWSSASGFQSPQQLNWGNPNLNFTAGTFGRITTIAGDPRIIQFGVKYAF